MTKAKIGSENESAGNSPARLIDARIKELGDWRGETLAHIRKLIKEANPDVVEEWKWRGVPVWYDAGMICTGETYKNIVKMTFAKGASLEDPSGLFNSSLDGNTRRAIDIHEGDKINEKGVKVTHPCRRRVEHGRHRFVTLTLLPWPSPETATRYLDAEEVPAVLSHGVSSISASSSGCWT